MTDEHRLRLNKFVSRGAGVSRRAADALIFDGQISLNGKICENPAVTVNILTDAVFYRGEKLSLKQKHTYILLHKPAGCVTSRRDKQGRRTVLDFLPENLKGLYPVGRLDFNTSGVLLLTDDGDFCAFYTHPKHKILKTYEAVVSGVFTEDDAKRLLGGVYINKFSQNKRAPKKEERVFVLAKEVEILKADKGGSRVQITVESGVNRQIRKMLNAVGAYCVSLTRLKFGPFALGELKAGEFCYLEANRDFILLKQI